MGGGREGMASLRNTHANTHTHIHVVRCIETQWDDLRKCLINTVLGADKKYTNWNSPTAPEIT